MSALRAQLHRYWFEFEPGENTRRVGAGLGVGATGVDRDDAERLVGELLFGGDVVPAVVAVVEEVDVRTLDEGHVQPNMGDPTVRGVWYPRV